MVALLVVAATLAIVLSRPYEGGLFRGAASGGDWVDHTARVHALGAAQADAPFVRFVHQTDSLYPPGLHWTMAAAGHVTGHEERAIGRAMVAWLVLLALAAGVVTRQVTGKPADGWLAVGATACVPGLAAVSLTYYFDLPMTAWLWCAVAWMVALRPRSPEAAGIGAGALWFAAAITKWTALPFGAVMLGGALLVHLPGESWTRKEVLRRLRAAAALALVTGLLLQAWFGASTTSWEAMSDITMGDSGAWSAQNSTGGLGGLVTSVADKLQPMSIARLGSYPANLLSAVLSPVVAVLLATLAGLWLWRDRRGLWLVAGTVIGQWAVLFWLVPPLDPRFLLTLTPALVLAGVLGLEQVPERARVGVLALWMGLCLLVIADVHHGERSALNHRWPDPATQYQGPWTGRGLSLDSTDPKTGWRRADMVERPFAPGKEQLWDRVVACGAHDLVVEEGALADWTDLAWWTYRNHLAEVTGELHFQRVVALDGFDPRLWSAVVVSRDVELPGWQPAGALGELKLWKSRPDLCPE